MQVNGITPGGFSPPTAPSRATSPEPALPTDALAPGRPVHLGLTRPPTDLPATPQPTSPRAEPPPFEPAPPDENEAFRAGLRRAERRHQFPELLKLDLSAPGAKERVTELAHNSQDPLVRRLARQLWMRHCHPIFAPILRAEPPPKREVDLQATPAQLVERAFEPAATAADREALADALGERPENFQLRHAPQPVADHPDDTSAVTLTRALVKAYPEVVTPEFFDREIMPLLKELPSLGALFARSLAEELIDRHPPLRDRMADNVVNDRERNLDYLDGRDLDTLSLAFEKGWQPTTATQKDWLAQWLLPGDRASTQKVLGLMATDPSRYLDCELPDPEGNVVALPEALLLHVTDGPLLSPLVQEAIQAPVRTLAPVQWQKDAIAVISQGDPERLLARTEQIYGGNLALLSETERARIALLSTMQGTREPLTALLQGERENRGEELAPLLERYLREPRRAEILQGIGPEQTCAQNVRSAREGVNLALVSGSEDHLSAMQTALKNALQSASPVARREQADKLLQALENLDDHQSSSHVPDEAIANLALLTPFLELDPELRQTARPLFDAFGRVDANGWKPGWVSAGNQLSRRLMTAIADELPGKSAPEQRDKIREANELAFAFGKNRQSHLTTPLDRWLETSVAPQAHPQAFWATERTEWMETGMAAVDHPELRHDWARGADDLKGSRRFPPVAAFAEKVAARILPDELERLKQPDLTLWERSRRFGTALHLAHVASGVRGVENAFLENASDWEKSLWSACQPSDAARVHAYIASRDSDPARVWTALEPVTRNLAGHPSAIAHMVGALSDVGSRDCLPEIAQFGSLVSALGPEKAYDCTRLFREVKDLEKRGLSPEQGLAKVVRGFLKLDPERGGQLSEGPRGVTLGGVMLRKRTRS